MCVMFFPLSSLASRPLAYVPLEPLKARASSKLCSRITYPYVVQRIGLQSRSATASLLIINNEFLNVSLVGHG